MIGTRQLTGIGLTRESIAAMAEAGRLHRLHRGVYAVGHRALTRKARWMAAVLAAGDAAHLSHRDGAALLEVADFAGGDIELTVPGLGGRSQPGIRIHRTRNLPGWQRTVVSGIPVTTVERTLIDLAGAIAPRHLRSAYLEAQRKGLFSPILLDQAMDGSRGRRGIGRLRRIHLECSDAYVETRSQLEVDFLDFCRRQQLPEPQVNVSVGGYLVDAYWPEARLAVELDGWEYHRGRESFERDRARIGDLRLAGITVIPLTHRRLATEPERVAETIRAAIPPPDRGEADSA